MKEKVISDLFLHIVVFNACTKSQKIKRNEELYFSKILEKGNDDSAHKEFKEMFTKQKIIGKRVAKTITQRVSEENAKQSRGRQQFRGKKKLFRSNSKPGYYKCESKDKSQGERDQ